ncbi:hypothetical protein CPB83DRAFT_161640 [Crepidotus variabilis]|uniref:Uncharacterized protein n=1 Tax=Crepidotus variabilis TaxID=179855 RepID=A0A9P6EKL5_9AGAR|nr:hypothetical protein CPB83DRAFT_161640 [Crepidotus variabilis]
MERCREELWAVQVDLGDDYLRIALTLSSGDFPKRALLASGNRTLMFKENMRVESRALLSSSFTTRRIPSAGTRIFTQNTHPYATR